MTVIIEFHELLRDAFNADEEYDLFDVHSEIKESRETWERLGREATAAKLKLISFIRENPGLEVLL